MASDVDTRLWRTVSRIWWVLALGVLGLLIGLGPRPQRSDSVFGLLIVVLVTVLALVALWRIPRPARAALPLLPRHRPLLTVTALLLGCATVLVLCWTIGNLVTPGTLAPLTLALLGVIAAGVGRVAGGLLRRG